MNDATNPAWHVPTEDLDAYAHERSADAQAWSIETHLPECSLCRAHLNDAIARTNVGSDVATSKVTVMSTVAPALQAPRATPAPARRVPTRLNPVSRAFLGRTPWLAGVVVVTLMAVLADLGWRHFAATSAWRLDSVLLLLGPVLPLAGVAFVCSRSSDPCAEVVLSTPSAGLRMVLWRTLTVLLVATPLTAAIGIATGGFSVTAVLLPTVAITMATLALGSRIGLDTAAALIGAAWTLLVIAPSVATTTMVLPAYAESTYAWWGAVIALGAAVTLWRRDAYERLTSLGIRHEGGR